MRDDAAVDHSFLVDVLNARDGETEEELDARLRSEADSLGVPAEPRPASAGAEAPVVVVGRVVEPPATSRRSHSVDSMASHLLPTNFNGCEPPKDFRSSTRHSRRSCASLSFRDYDAFLARGKPNGRHSISFSPFATSSPSTFSLPLSQPLTQNVSSKRHFRRFRGLSKLRFHRTDSAHPRPETCSHCSQSVSDQSASVHKLPCGHTLCTQVLRDTIMSATVGSKGAVPSCCDTPIPGSLVERVMTQEEQKALLDKLMQWDEAVSLVPSTDSEAHDSTMSFRRDSSVQSSQATSATSRDGSLSLRDKPNMTAVMERADFKTLLDDQYAQRDAFVAWATKQRAALRAHHDSVRDERRSAQQDALDTLFEEHMAAMSEAEDKQVHAEAELREAHGQETRDLATALKHMEAYCAGTYSTTDLRHHRPVTDQDRAELDKARRASDTLPARHDSSINVLRGEQDRRMRLRGLRHERETQELRRQQRREELELERSWSAEMHGLEEQLAGKRRRMSWRWALQAAVLAKQLETQAGITAEGRLPTADWDAVGRQGAGEATQEALPGAGR